METPEVSNINPVKPYKCDYPSCLSSFSIKFHLKRHIKMHEGVLPYKCLEEGCVTSFAKHYQLIRHQNQIHQILLPYVCTKEGCQRRFLYPSKLKRHLNTHIENLKYLCGEHGCEENFSKWSSLRTHIKEVHHSEKRKKIIEETELEEKGEEMDLEVESSGILERMKEDLVINSWLGCTICGKSFTSRSSLLCHLQNLHSIEDLSKPENLSNISNVSSLDPIVVKKLLSSPKNYSCGWVDCTKSFRTKHAVKVHHRTLHEGRRPFECDLCQSSFGHKHLLARHKRQIHSVDLNNQLTERIKGKKEARKENQPDNVNEKPSVASLLSGIEYVSERPISCPSNNCMKRFKRQYDLKRHISSAHQTNLFLN